MTNASVCTREQIEMLLGGEMPKTEKADTKPAFPASPAQLKFYHDLCEQRRIEPEDKEWSGAELRIEIDRLKSTPKFLPISEKQINKIKGLCDSMNMKYPANLEKLDGSYGGQASQLIQKLLEMSKHVKLKPTEIQLNKIRDMQLCPDCASLTELEIVDLSKQEASDYIGKYNTDFIAWKKTRLSAEQFKIIEELTEKLGDKIKYESIIQLSSETAVKYIDELKLELKDKTLTETTLEPEEMRGYKTRDKEDERNALRSAVTLLYYELGQELEDEFYETLDWSGLKELVEMVVLFGGNARAILEDAEIFEADQIEALLAQ